MGRLQNQGLFPLAYVILDPRTAGPSFSKGLSQLWAGIAAVHELAVDFPRPEVSAQASAEIDLGDQGFSLGQVFPSLVVYQSVNGTAQGEIPAAVPSGFDCGSG